MHCIHCGSKIPWQRLQIRPDTKTCVNCTTEERVSGVPVINHKTGNEIQIVKDPEVAEEFLRKSARTGYGTLRGVSSGNTNATKRKVKGLVGTTATIPGKDSFERIGRIALREFELFGMVHCRKYISNSINNRSITKQQGEKILYAINLLHTKG